MNVLGIGPYIGDFKQEFLTFRPYARWLTNVVEYDKVYLSTHFNRSFMYNFIPKQNILPVYEIFSRNEQGQEGYIHKELQQKDYNLLVRKFKDKIVGIESCNKKDIEVHHLNYVKSTPHYPIFNKVFDKISKPNNINIPKEHKNKLIFIPAISENQIRSERVYDHLQSSHDFLVVGDMDTYFSGENVVLSNIDYSENGWKYIIEYIAESKGVICPISHWTALCNLQNKPVFSWGLNPGQYREDGIYYFNNDKSTIIATNEETDIRIITKMMDFFIKEVQITCGNSKKVAP